MSQVFVLDIMRNGFLTVIKVASPILLVALTVGFIISILQATTQVQEQTLSFVPKIIAVMISLIIFGNYMLNTLVNFGQDVINAMSTLN